MITGDNWVSDNGTVQLFPYSVSKSDEIKDSKMRFECALTMNEIWNDLTRTRMHPIKAHYL